MKKIFLIILVLFASSCTEEANFVTDGNGLIIKMSPLWKSPQDDDTSIDAGGSVFLSGKIIYNNYRLFGGNINEEKYLVMRNIETGEKLWEWRDFLSNASLYLDHSHQYQNYLFFQSRSTNGGEHYFINLETGQTVWKKQRTISFDTYYKGLDEHYFSIHYEQNKNGLYEGIVYKGNVLTGEQDTLFRPNYSREHVVIGPNAIGFLDALSPFKHENKSYIAAIFRDPQEKQGAVQNTHVYIALYDLTQDTLVYGKELVYQNAKARVLEEPVIINDKIYMAGGGFVACNNVYTGKSVWKKSFTATFYGLAVDGNTVLINSGYDNQYNSANLYALDRETGRQLWRVTSSDLSSDLVTLNGVVYFTGGGDGYLHAVDIETGKHIWRLISPDEEHNSGAFFRPEITAVPGRNGNKGIILTSSYLSAMAFEAAR